MQKIKNSNQIPSSSIIEEGFETVHYYDSYTVVLSSIPETIDRVAENIFHVPAWVNALMNLRNFLVRFVGLSPGKRTETEIYTEYPVGSRLVYFTVLARNENEIVLGEKDKHLNFRVSVLVDRTHSTVSLITLVHFNKGFGRFYFFFVKPFHKLIIRSLLKRESVKGC